MRYTLELTPGELAMIHAALETQGRVDARCGIGEDVLLAAARAKVAPVWRRFCRDQRAAERALGASVATMVAD